MEASFVLALISSSCTWCWQTFATASGGLLNTGSHAKEELLHTGFLCLQIGLDTVSQRLPWPGWATVLTSTPWVDLDHLLWCTIQRTGLSLWTDSSVA